MGDERPAPRVGVALFDGSRLDSVVNTDSRWPTSLWLTEQLYLGAASTSTSPPDAWSRHAPCLRRTRYAVRRSPRSRVDLLLRRRANTAKPAEHAAANGARADDVVSYYSAKSEAAIDFRRSAAPGGLHRTASHCGGAPGEAMDTCAAGDEQTEVRKTVTFTSDVDEHDKVTGERRERGRSGGGDSIDGSRVESEPTGGVVPQIGPYLNGADSAWPSENGFVGPPYNFGSSRDGGAPPRPTVDPSVSNTARQLLHRKLRTQVLSFPRISVELQRKALGSAPRYENIRNAVYSARAHARTPAHFGAGPPWAAVSSERAGLPTLQTPTDDRKSHTPTTVAANQYGPRPATEGRPRDKYSRMTALGLPRVNIDIDRPLSYSRPRRSRNHLDAGDTETVVSDVTSVERARAAAEVIHIPVEAGTEMEAEAEVDEPEEEAWPGDVVAQTNGIDLDAVSAAAATENGVDHAPRHVTEKTTRPAGNAPPQRRKEANSCKARHHDAPGGVIGVSCKIETPRKDLVVPPDTTGR